MPDNLEELSAAALAWAVEANLYAFFRQMGEAPSVEFVESGPVISWQTAIPHPWFNGVLAAEAAPPEAEQIIGERLAYFKGRGVERMSWWLEPHVDPMGWEAHLLRAGFRVDDHTPGMAIALDKLEEPEQLTRPRPEGLAIVPVADEATLRTWVIPFVTGFGLSPALEGIFFDMLWGMGLGLPLRHYLGYLDGEPVATSTLFLGAGVAGVYNVATRPNARGRGLGTALTLAPLRDARAMGYRVGILQSSEKGFPVYRRLGFETVCSIRNYDWREAGGQEASG